VSSPFITATKVAEISRLAHAIADISTVADIESECVASREPGSAHRWYDTRPMVDPREHCNEFIEMAEQVLAYARMRGLIVQHPERTHLVRIHRKT
jgi:hypothetical protein